MRDVVIVLGSTSKHKRVAVCDAAEDLRIRAMVDCVKTPSGINEQPYGLDETRRGALNRAKAAQEMQPSADLFVGIESGLVCADGIYLDMTMIVVLTSGGRVFSSVSAGHQVPLVDVHAAIAQGFKSTTAGDMMAKRTGCDSTDGTAFVTGEHVTRLDAIQQAVKIALATWLKETT